MSKDERRKNDFGKDRRDTRNDNRNEVKIPDDVKALVKMKFKKFKKENEDFFDSKKDLKKAYLSTMAEYLPKTILFIINRGHIQVPEVQETKKEIYEKIADPDFIKYLTKCIEKEEEIENIRLFPIIAQEIMTNAAKANAARIAEDPKAEIYDVADIIELNKLILKKKVKKLVKAGIPEAIALDVLSVIPTSKALGNSLSFKVRTLFNVMYEHAKTTEFKFDQVIKVLIEEELYPVIISYALSEKKERYASMNESQQNFWKQINDWLFSTLEEQQKDVVMSVLKNYVSLRKRDMAASKDSARRFTISSLPESEYPKIAKTVKVIISEDDAAGKLL